MPIYTYECSKCKEIFEIKQSMKDSKLKKHSENMKSNCDGIVKRIITSISGFIFKGPGFYVNDKKSSEKSMRNE